MADENFSDYIMGPFKEWVDYIKVNGLRYYLKLLKINFLATIAAIALLGIFATGGLALAFILGLTGLTTALEALASNMTLIIALITMALMAMIVTNWVQESIRLTTITFTDAEFRNKRFSILESANEIKTGVFRYLMINWGIWVLVILPILLILGIIITGGYSFLGGVDFTSPGTILASIAILAIAYLVIIIYVTIASIIMGFLFQFWTYGFLLDKVGVIEALKQSLGLVRRRFFHIVVFDLFWVMGMVIASTPIMAYSFMSRIVFQILQVFAVAGGIAGLIIFLLLIALNTVILILLATIVQAFATPTHYLFWRKLKGH